jgi:hypothetical protein
MRSNGYPETVSEVRQQMWGQLAEQGGSMLTLKYSGDRYFVKESYEQLSPLLKESTPKKEEIFFEITHLTTPLISVLSTPKLLKTPQPETLSSKAVERVVSINNPLAEAIFLAVTTERTKQFQEVAHPKEISEIRELVGARS